MLVTEPSPVLIAFEAKLYDRPSRPDLLTQLQAQDTLLRTLVDQLRRMLDRPVRLVHAALLPAALASAVGDLGVPTITWERPGSTFQHVAPPYFDAIATAIKRYPDQRHRHPHPRGRPWARTAAIAVPHPIRACVPPADHSCPTEVLSCP